MGGRILLGDFEKIAFLRFAMGLFSPTHAFSGGFWQISPLGGPRGGIKVGVQRESCLDHYSAYGGPIGSQRVPGGPREFGEDPSRPKIERKN